MKKISRFVASSVFVVSFCVPFFAAAQINTTIIKGYSDSIIGIINSILVPVLIAIAFITFLWGVYKYFILGAAEPKSREEGQQFVMWGIIGFVIILSLWGIVNLFTSTLGLTASNVPAYPTIGGSSVPAGYTGANTTFFPGAGTTVGGGTLGNTGGVTAAQQSYNTCIGGSGNSAAQCQATYQAAGGTGNPQQNLAQQAYDTCIGNGNSATVCQPAYQAYGGTGSGTQNLAQSAYNTCIANGNSDATCQSAYQAYGGSGTANSSGNGPGVGATGNASFDACIAAGGGVAECRAQTGGTSAGVTAGNDCTYSACASGLTCNYDSTRGYSVCEASSGGSNNPSVSGCTDPSATNYNPSATVGDGSCTINDNTENSGT